MFQENFTESEARQEALPDHIYMDHMGFGMGKLTFFVFIKFKNVKDCVVCK